MLMRERGESSGVTLTWLLFALPEAEPWPLGLRREAWREGRVGGEGDIVVFELGTLSWMIES